MIKLKTHRGGGETVETQTVEVPPSLAQSSITKTISAGSTIIISPASVGLSSLNSLNSVAFLHSTAMAYSTTVAGVTISCVSGGVKFANTNKTTAVNLRMTLI